MAFQMTLLPSSSDIILIAVYFAVFTILTSWLFIVLMIIITYLQERSRGKKSTGEGSKFDS